MEAWQKCIDIMEQEQDMLKIDGTIDDVVDAFVTDVGYDCSSSSE